MGIFGMLYYAGYRVKRASDLARQKRLPVPVISIGNLTVGGTGKTPAAIALAREAARRGYHPAVLTRGYKGRLKGPCVVEKHMDPVDVGDEPLLMAIKLGGVPVVKGADRYRSGMFALESLSPKPDLFILDDGFQHLRLYRDVNILLVSYLNPFDDMKLLPVGLLREPLSQIGRADAAVITKSAGNEDQELVEFIGKYNSSAPVFYSDHAPSFVRTPDGKEHSLDWLKGKEVYAVCGIAEPASFEHVLESSGAMVNGLTPYPDHYAFSQADIEDFTQLAQKSGAGWIITTEKDIMRLRGMQLPQNLVSLEIEFTIGNEFYDYVFRREED